MSLRTANALRKRFPFAYWLLFDAVVTSLLFHGWTHYSWVFAVGLPFAAVAIFFDCIEAAIKFKVIEMDRVDTSKEVGHTGAPVYRSEGGGVLVLCAEGRHVIEFVRAGEWAQSVWEMRAGDRGYVVNCHGTIL